MTRAKRLYEKGYKNEKIKKKNEKDTKKQKDNL